MKGYSSYTFQGPFSHSVTLALLLELGAGLPRRQNVVAKGLETLLHAKVPFFPFII